MHRITLEYGADDPLLLEVADDALVADCRGPRGAAAAAARTLVTAAADEPVAGPPLAAHVVPGDRVVIALAGAVPRAADVVAAVVERLATAGAPPGEVTVLAAPPLEVSVRPAAHAIAVAPPGGVGATQGLTTIALHGAATSQQIAAYSLSQQLVLTLWNCVLATALVLIYFGWSGGRTIVTNSLVSARSDMKEKREESKQRKAEKKAAKRADGA